jgi:hypothetical protein
MMAKEKRASLIMESKAFVTLWLSAIDRDPNESQSQLDWLVLACKAKFLDSEAGKKTNHQFLAENTGLSDAELMELIATRAYNKCSSLKARFKKAGYEAPDYPKKGSSGASASTRSLAALMGLSLAPKTAE